MSKLSANYDWLATYMQKVSGSSSFNPEMHTSQIYCQEFNKITPNEKVPAITRTAMMLTEVASTKLSIWSAPTWMGPRIK
jgi:hypothetical protein